MSNLGSWPCPCGRWVTEADVVDRQHIVGGAVTYLSRCSYCVKQSLCATNLYGAHREVYTPSDEEFQPQYLTLDGQVVPAPNPDRFGYCSGCHQPLYWDAEDRQQVRALWRDLTWLDLAREWELV